MSDWDPTGRANPIGTWRRREPERGGPPFVLFSWWDDIPSWIRTGNSPISLFPSSFDAYTTTTTTRTTTTALPCVLSVGLPSEPTVVIIRRENVGLDGWASWFFYGLWPSFYPAIHWLEAHCWWLVCPNYATGLTAIRAHTHRPPLILYHQDPNGGSLFFWFNSINSAHPVAQIQIRICGRTSEDKRFWKTKFYPKI